MANRCQSCGKLCGLETEEPEIDLSIEGNVVKAQARIVRNSECCGDEVKSAELEVSEELPAGVLAGHVLNSEVKATLEAEKAALLERITKIDEILTEHELEVETEDVEATERSEGKGRGRKSFYGFTVNYAVRCSCQDECLHQGTLSDDIQASSMDES